MADENSTTGTQKTAQTSASLGDKADVLVSVTSSEQTPSWLLQAQKDVHDVPVAEPVIVEETQTIPDWLKTTQQLKEHEEKAVVPSLSGVVESEDPLAGLTFEGEAAPVELTKLEPDNHLNSEVESVDVNNVLPSPSTESQSGNNALPEWLKTLQGATSVEQKLNPQVETITHQQQAILEYVTPDTPEKQKLTDQQIKNAALNPEDAQVKIQKSIENVVEMQQVSGKNIEAAQQKAQQKANFFAGMRQGFLSFLDKSKSEIAHGKIAGIQEAETTIDLHSIELLPTSASAVKPVKPLTSGQLKAHKSQADAKERLALLEAEKIFQEGMATVRDLIAPSSMEIRYDLLRIEGLYAKSFYVYSYPRYLDTNWLSPVVNFDVTIDIAQFIYPIDSAKIMQVLRKKVTQMQVSMNMNAEKGLVRDPALETAYEDAEQLRTEIQRGQEKFFQFAMYFTIYADDEKKITKVSKQLESILGSKLILTKRADLRMEHGFNSTLPLCLDELEIYHNMNTSPLSTTFPFTSADLTSNEGILYGLNRHNDSLIIFDRFSLENANSVVFAKSGAGKSYAVKLEILRSLMLGTDVIVIDPEQEYEALCQTVGGSYLKMSLNSDRRINPFDLPSPMKDEEVQPGDLLRSNIINLHGLLKIMLDGLSPVEEGIIDKALNDVYAIKGITMEIQDPTNLPVPTMEDLYDILNTMEGGLPLAQRLQKFTQGTYSGIFNKPTNLDIKSGLMVFNIRDLEDALRPIAMYIILNFIWNRIRSSLKKRMLVIDEAWIMMQYEDSARFLFGLVKRARKYYVGITTITQDVEDFMKSPYGKPIVTNSSMQLLLKQAPAAIDVVAKTFSLTEGEKYLLLNSGIGQGLFFAGLKHVAIQIIASYTEDKIVTTNPEEILRNLGNSSEQTFET